MCYIPIRQERKQKCNDNNTERGISFIDEFIYYLSFAQKAGGSTSVAGEAHP